VRLFIRALNSARGSFDVDMVVCIGLNVTEPLRAREKHGVILIKSDGMVPNPVILVIIIGKGSISESRLRDFGIPVFKNSKIILIFRRAISFVFLASQ
jgi:hypothetical protein